MSGCGGSTLTEYCHPVQPNSLRTPHVVPRAVSSLNLCIFQPILKTFYRLGISVLKFNQKLPLRKTFL